MTKLILLIFLFILSNFSFGQSSLDSLRLVIPVGHKSYISEILLIPKSEKRKPKLLTSDGEVNCVWDYSSKKLLYTFRAKTHNGLFNSNKYNLIINVEDDTLYARRIEDGSISYLTYIGSSIFKEDWTNETVDKILLSSDEKSILVIYQNHTKHIWKVSMYDVASGLMINNFSGEYFEHFNLTVIPTNNFVLVDIDNSIHRLEFYQEKKSQLIVEFQNTINLFQIINGTNYSYIKINNKVIVYDLLDRIKKSEFEGEHVYMKDSILITLNKNHLLIYNVLTNLKIASLKLRKIEYDSGELIEPTVVFSNSTRFLGIKHGNKLYSIEIAQKRILEDRASEEFALRYVSDFGDLILEEQLFKCLINFNFNNKTSIELFCPDQFDGNGEVNFQSLIYQDPNLTDLFIGGFRQIVQVNLLRMEKICEYKPQIKTNTAIQFDPVTKNIIIQGYDDFKQLPIDLSSDGRIIENMMVPILQTESSYC